MWITHTHTSDERRKRNMNEWPNRFDGDISYSLSRRQPIFQQRLIAAVVVAAPLTHTRTHNIDGFDSHDSCVLRHRNATTETKTKPKTRREKTKLKAFFSRFGHIQTLCIHMLFVLLTSPFLWTEWSAKRIFITFFLFSILRLFFFFVSRTPNDFRASNTWDIFHIFLTGVVVLQWPTARDIERMEERGRGRCGNWRRATNTSATTN